MHFKTQGQKMCHSPITLEDGQVTSCRNCSKCIQTKINDWAARAELEGETAAECVALTLTYRPLPDGSDPIGAVAFRYKDVSAFLKKLRVTYTRFYKVPSDIRFLCVGEMGSENKRVHYHLLIFSRFKIEPLGEWSKFGKPVLNPYRVKQVEWTEWDHGYTFIDDFQQIQEDGLFLTYIQKRRKGIRYTVAYCQKDRFGIIKARGEKHEARAENWTGSKFNMSKRPAFGIPYLENHLAEHREALTCPLSLNIRLPSGGYYYPQGKIREWYIYQLRELCDFIKDQTGRFPAGYSTLLASIPETLADGSDNSDYERFIYGEIEQSDAPPRPFQLTPKFTSQATILLSRCGSAFPCASCREQATPEQLGELRDSLVKTSSGNAYRHEIEVDPNPCCLLKGTPDVERVFNQRRAYLSFKKRVEDRATRSARSQNRKDF